MKKRDNNPTPNRGNRSTLSPVLRALLNDYENASPEFKATQYWKDAQKELNISAATMDRRLIRAGRYDSLRKFGFGDLIYSRPPPGAGWFEKAAAWVLSILAVPARRIPGVLPYGLNLARIRQLAFRHCDYFGRLAGAPPLSTISVSSYGSPKDIFKVHGRTYTMQFLSMYMRYAFAHSALKLKGNEIVVELGQGNGIQVELLKKLYPDLTILCFDLPVQNYFSEIYLTNALGRDCIVSAGKTRNWKRLSAIQHGKVHFFGSWQFPLLSTLKRIDLFWNAASFGEMEPEIVANYLSYVKPLARRIYLCNAAKGKECDRGGRSGSTVTHPVGYEDYMRMLEEFDLVRMGPAWTAVGPMSQSGGYFQAVWKRKKERSTAA